MGDENELDLTKIKIRIIPNSSGTMRAQVELRIGIIKIIGYRIHEFSNKQYEVYPPQVPNSNKSKGLNIVQIEDKVVWQELKNLIITEYLNPTKNVEKNENIDPEEIPF